MKTIMGAVIVMAGIFLASYYLEQHEPATSEMIASTTSARNSLAFSVGSKFKMDAKDSVELSEFLRNGDISAYMPKSRFEDIPYPNRKSLMQETVATWCRFIINQPSIGFSPSVAFKDLKSGETLGIVVCSQIPNNN